MAAASSEPSSEELIKSLTDEEKARLLSELSGRVQKIEEFLSDSETGFAKQVSNILAKGLEPFVVNVNQRFSTLEGRITGQPQGAGSSVLKDILDTVREGLKAASTTPAQGQLTEMDKEILMVGRQSVRDVNRYILKLVHEKLGIPAESLEKISFEKP